MMKALRAFGIAVLTVVLGAAVGLAQEPPFSEVLEGVLPGIGAADIGDREKPQQQLQKICFSLGAPGRETQRTEACKLMAAKLGPDTAKPARVWLLKQLQLIGRAECVDAVAALLDDTDAEIRDAALAALANNTASEANAKLLAQLSAAGGVGDRVALIHALGYHADPTSVEALGMQLGDADASAAAAAAGALGKIGGAEAARLLASTKQGSSALRQAIADARLCCANQMLNNGNAAEAAIIYQELIAPSQPRPIRLGAMAGRLRAAGDGAVTMLLEWLGGDDSDASDAAVAHVGQLNSQAALARLEADLFKLPAPSQIMLLNVLAAKGDKSAMSVAASAVKCENPEVRITGLAALGKLGDTSVVPQLIELTLSDTSVAGLAREGLQQVVGAGVNEAIAEAMERAAVPARIQLIEVLEARGAVVAVPALLKQAEQQDAVLCATAVRALGRLAEPKDVPALIALVLKTPKGRERDDVEKAIVFVCNMQDAQQRSRPMLAAYCSAAPEQQQALLAVLGRIGDPEALKAVKEAIQSSDVALADAGVRALCHWPDSTVAGELLELAGGAAKQDHRIMALRAYVRVITTPAAVPDVETLESLDKVMHMAGRDEDKRLILSRCTSVRSMETVRWLVPYLDDQALAGEASKAIVDLARRKELFTPNRDECIQVLQKVIEVGGDRDAVEHAQRIVQGL